MHEAVSMAGVVAGLLNRHKVKDGGADYRMVVTDTAGNVAEVLYSPEDAQWVADEGYDAETLSMRFRAEITPQPEQERFPEGTPRPRSLPFSEEELAAMAPEKREQTIAVGRLLDEVEEGLSEVCQFCGEQIPREPADAYCLKRPGGGSHWPYVARPQDGPPKPLPGGPDLWDMPAEPPNPAEVARAMASEFIDEDDGEVE